MRYTEDGRLSVDNTLSERTLRVIALGRKNWKFAGNTPSGANASDSLHGARKLPLTGNRPGRVPARRAAEVARTRCESEGRTTR
ncbi:MAG: IS66 family transposase [Planctomycetes bacterium]|nr:IS66 family transposase [Planctomycetota bacterium]